MGNGFILQQLQSCIRLVEKTSQRNQKEFKVENDKKVTKFTRGVFRSLSNIYDRISAVAVCTLSLFQIITEQNFTNITDITEQNITSKKLLHLSSYCGSCNIL